MRQKPGTRREPAEKVVKDIGRKSRRQFSGEEKSRIVLEGLRGEVVIAPVMVWWLAFRAPYRTP